MTQVERRYEEPEGAVLEHIDSLPTTFLECRTLGHAWKIRWWGNVRDVPEDLVPQVVREFRWDLMRVSICLRCETIRDEFFPKTKQTYERFHCQYRRYRYPSEYQVKGHGGSPRRAIFSRTAYERWVSGDNAFIQ